MSETIEDIVILGRAVPERLKDGRITVCLGGISQTRGFIRLYPTRLKMAIRRWDVIRAEVERNERDTRDESWKIVGSGSYWEEVEQHVSVVGQISDPYDRRQIVLANLSACVNVVNEAHKSLGIVRPRQILKRYFSLNPQYGQLFTPMLFPEYGESWANVKSDYEEEPRLKYVCSDCQAAQHHDQKVLEWGFFEWIRKNPDNKDQVWENAKFDSKQHEIFLFVGNQAQRRTSFVIISVLPIQKDPQPPKPQQPSLL